MMPLTYDDRPGSWGDASEGWPDTDYTTRKWKLCVQGVVPYGSYVCMGDRLRIETVELRDKLERAAAELDTVSTLEPVRASSDVNPT